MAILEKVTAYKAPPKKGALLRNMGRAWLDVAASPLEGILGTDLTNFDYEGGNADKWDKFSQIGSSIGNKVGSIGLGVATGGMGNLASAGVNAGISGMQGAMQDMVPPIPSNIVKYGGKIYGKRGKRYFQLGGVLDEPLKTLQPSDAELVKKAYNNPTKAVQPVSGSVRFLPNGDIVDLKAVTPPTLTPEQLATQIAQIQAEEAAYAKAISGQKRMGGVIPKSVENPLMNWKDGGSLLTEYKGNTHENGGIPISDTDEVEDGENSFNTKDGNKYIFSDSILMPGTKRTFAQGGKRIASKYKLREGDRMAEKAQQLELEKLSELQEGVKEFDKQEEANQEYTSEYKKGGIFIKPSKRGTFTAAAKKHGESVQGFASKVLAYKESYSPAMVKKANFARNAAKWHHQFGGVITPPFFDGNPPFLKFGGKYNPDPADKALFVSDEGKYNYGGTIVPSTNDGYVPTTTDGYDEGGYLNTMYTVGGIMPSTLEYINQGLALKQPITKIQPKGFPASTNNPVLSNAPKSSTGLATKTTGASPYKPGYGTPLAGYGIQALANLPAFFRKPAKVNFQRVTPETVDLSSQRDEARRARNLQLAMAQRQAGQMSNAGQAGAYSNAVTSGIMGNYGDAFNQSLMQEQGANVGIRNQANAQNAQIQMQEQIARQQEEDAIASGKQQALMNIGQAGAMFGQNAQQMKQQGDYLTAMGIANPDYGLQFGSTGNAWKDFMRGTSITPYRKRRCGGKMKSKVGRKV